MCLVALALPGLAPATPKAAAEADWEQIRAELEAMFVTDQKRADIAPGDGEAWRVQSAVDRDNLKRLDELIEAYGWPGLSQVGERAASAAFLIVQHADHPAQKRLFPVLAAARDAGEIHPRDLALLEDRILMREGKPQIYGSQVVWSETQGAWSVYTIEDPDNVDELRASVGLGPIADDLARLGATWPPREESQP